MGFKNEVYCALWFGILLWFNVGQVLSAFGIMFIDNMFDDKGGIFGENVGEVKAIKILYRNLLNEIDQGMDT